MPKKDNFSKIYIGIVILSSLIICPVSAQEYDGIWFLGFNLKHAVLKELPVRQAINLALDKQFIVQDVISAESIPASFVPPGLLGYDPDLASPPQNVKAAKALMRKAHYLPDNRKLKNLTLLHTDGVKTVAIAQKIKKDLKILGISLTLREVNYADDVEWDKALSSGEYDFFLMGYKAGIDQLFSEDTPNNSKALDGYDILFPLFSRKGEANFTGYSNPQIDTLFSQTAGLDRALKNERHVKLKLINQALYHNLPAVVLFYIEKM